MFADHCLSNNSGVIFWITTGNINLKIVMSFQTRRVDNSMSTVINAYTWEMKKFLKRFIILIV